MKYILAFLISSLFLGCTTTIPPKVEYRIHTDTKIQAFSEKSCKDKSLKIAQAFSHSKLLTQNMNYRLGFSKQYIYSESLWSTSPNRAISSEFLRVIRDSRLFKNVQISKSRSLNDYILEINIEDFMQYFNDDSSTSHVNVVINLSLINSRTKTIVASETFKEKLDVKNLDASGGVDGLNKALSSVLNNSNTWLSEVCK